jgi:hypothetical protein
MVGLPRPDHVERSVDGCAAQITFDVLHGVCLLAAPEQAQEDGLQDVFGVARIARDPVGCPEDEAVVRSIRLLDFVGNRDRRFL